MGNGAHVDRTLVAPLQPRTKADMKLRGFRRTLFQGSYGRLDAKISLLLSYWKPRKDLLNGEDFSTGIAGGHGVVDDKIGGTNWHGAACGRAVRMRLCACAIG